jgi:hypothetical protein
MVSHALDQVNKWKEVIRRVEIAGVKKPIVSQFTAVIAAYTKAVKLESI